MMTSKEKGIRDALADFLGMLAHKARTGQMTGDDAEVLFRAIRDAGGIRATVKDMAGYYGQSEDNVRHIIHRNLLPAPERRVYYEFGAVRKCVPDKWRLKTRNLSE